MIRRLELINFMSHARTVIEPAEGLTVLVGPNNCGKSAVVAALQILCHNEPSNYVMRHNERECSVTVETSEGHVVEWSRRGKSPRYTINGKVFDRLDKGAVPEELLKTLCLPKVSADGNREFDVHFGEQKSPVFLIDKSGSHAAQFFASSSDAGKLIEVQKRHQQKMTEARKERSRCEAQVARLAGDLLVLSAADEFTERLQRVESEHHAIGVLAAAIERAQTDLDTLHLSAVALQARNAEADSLSPLGPPPVLAPAEPLFDFMSELAQTEAALVRHTSQSLALAPLSAVPELEEERPLVRLIGELSADVLAARRLEAECKATTPLQAPPSLGDVPALEALLRELFAIHQRAAGAHDVLVVLQSLSPPPLLERVETLTEDIRTLQSQRDVLDRQQGVWERAAALGTPPVLTDHQELAQCLVGIQQAVAAIKEHEQEVNQSGLTLQEAERALQQWAREQRVCPTCGGRVDPDQMTEHARMHLGGASHA